DLLGYTYMSLSTALLAPAFPGPGLRRWLRLCLLVNGSLGAILLPQLAWPWLIYLAAVWIVSFPCRCSSLRSRCGWTLTGRCRPVDDSPRFGGHISPEREAP